MATKNKQTGESNASRISSADWQEISLQLLEEKHEKAKRNGLRLTQSDQSKLLALLFTWAIRNPEKFVKVGAR